MQPAAAEACFLAHPSIAAIREHGFDGHLAYVVTEMAPGRDLSAYTRPSRLLPLPTVLGIVARVASALQHAHRRGVVHGDVKPGNIVFDAASGAASLVDFPLSARGICTTPAYAAPEHVCGAEASAACDQFALGVTLYQLCCGELPFTGRSRAEIAQRIVCTPHTDIRMRAPSIPGAVVALIDRALAKDPARRFRSVGRMAHAAAGVLGVA
jgi:serine/threonine protein kinase